MKNLQKFNQQLLNVSKILTITGLFLVMFLQASAQSGAVNFTGSWTLNESKSNFGDAQFRMAATTLVINQEANALSVDRVMPGFDGGEMKTTGKYTLDGKVCENTGMMDSKTKSTVTMAADKKSFVIASTSIFNMNGESMEFKSTETWKSEGEKTLKIETTNSTPNGEMKTTAVYDKK